MTWATDVTLLSKDEWGYDDHNFTTGAFEMHTHGITSECTSCQLTTTTSLFVWAQSCPPVLIETPGGDGYSAGLCYAIVSNGQVLVTDRFHIESRNDFKEVTLAEGVSVEVHYPLARQLTDGVAVVTCNFYESDHDLGHGYRVWSFRYSGSGAPTITEEWDWMDAFPEEHQITQMSTAISVEVDSLGDPAPGSYAVAYEEYTEDGYLLGWITWNPVTEELGGWGQDIDTPMDYVRMFITVDNTVCFQDGDDNEFALPLYELPYPDLEPLIPLTANLTEGSPWVLDEISNEVGVSIGDAYHTYGRTADNYTYPMMMELTRSGDTVSCEFWDNGASWDSEPDRISISYGWLGSDERWTVINISGQPASIYTNDGYFLGSFQGPIPVEWSLSAIHRDGVIDHKDPTEYAALLGFNTDPGWWFFGSEWMAETTGIIANVGFQAEDVDFRMYLTWWSPLAANLSGEFEMSDREFWRHRPGW